MSNNTLLKMYDRNELSTFYREQNNKYIKNYRLEEIKPLLNFIKNKKPKKILEACCGIGTHALLISKLTHSKIDAFDINKDYIREARKIKSKNINYFIGDLLSFSIGRKYDLIYMIDGLHHISNSKSAIKRVLKLLEPNGTAIILERNDENWFVFLSNRVFEPKTHIMTDKKIIKLIGEINENIKIENYCDVSWNVFLAKLFNFKKGGLSSVCLKKVRKLISINKTERK